MLEQLTAIRRALVAGEVEAALLGRILGALEERDHQAALRVCRTVSQMCLQRRIKKLSRRCPSSSSPITACVTELLPTPVIF